MFISSLVYDFVSHFNELSKNCHVFVGIVDGLFIVKQLDDSIYNAILESGSYILSLVNLEAWVSFRSKLFTGGLSLSDFILCYEQTFNRSIFLDDYKIDFRFL